MTVNAQFHFKDDDRNTWCFKWNIILIIFKCSLLLLLMKNNGASSQQNLVCIRVTPGFWCLQMWRRWDGFVETMLFVCKFARKVSWILWSWYCFVLLMKKNSVNPNTSWFMISLMSSLWASLWSYQPMFYDKFNPARFRVASMTSLYMHVSAPCFKESCGDM